MKKLVVELCSTRMVRVAQPKATQFIKECNSFNIHPTGGAYVNGCVIYELRNPLTDAEGEVIALAADLSGAYRYRRCHSMSPFQALADLNLL